MTLLSITIFDVAREAGTSISTVSKALNDSYTISEETKEHVRQVAKRLKYQPNVRAQALARKDGRQACFITCLPRGIGFQNPHMFEILAGAEKALAAKNYVVTIQGSDPKNVCALVKDIVQRKSADGLLLHASVVTRELAALLTKEEVPHIVIGMPSFSSRLCWIDNNNHIAGEIAAHHVLEENPQSIVFIGGKDKDKISQARLEGVKSELENAQRPIECLRVYQGESTAENGYRMALKMLEEGIPDTVICANNYLAYGCLYALQLRNIDIPRDVSMITFDSYPFAQITWPKLTTVSIDVFEMGLQAGKLLVNKIKKPNLQIQSFTTLPNLVVRESTHGSNKSEDGMPIKDD